MKIELDTIQIEALDLKKHLRLIVGVLVSGLITTFLLCGYYISIQKLTSESEVLNQKVRAKVLVEQIEKFAAIASQISRSLQIHFENKSLSPDEIENYLIESVKSGPDNLIYGIGIWFEPYQFDKNKKYFGPYVFRKQGHPKQIKLTYEWNSPTYNYPEQVWYKKGLQSTSQGTFIEPYFDDDYVYVTLSAPFKDKNNNVKGVISVDMILPQLQSMIDQINQSPDEVIYVQSAAQSLLAHPARDEFFDKNKQYKNKSLIEFKIDDFKKGLSLNKSQSELMIHSELVSDLGWSVIVETQKSLIFKDSNRLFLIILIAILVLWCGLFFGLYSYIKAKKIKLMNEQKNSNQQLQLINSSRLATLGEFSSGVAHEINNPLAIIYGKTGLLIKKIDNNTIASMQIKEEIEHIKTNADRISKIIRGLKTFSRDGKSDPPIEVSLKDLFTDTFSISAERIKTKKIHFEIIEFDDVRILCRPAQISQVLLNLMTNAVDAIDGQDKPWIQIKVLVDQYIQIFFTDSGLGIPLEVQEKMMNPFFTTKDIGKGTGLGLSISLGIINDHNGELTYNPDSVHTQFIIQLAKCWD